MTITWGSAFKIGAAVALVGAAVSAVAILASSALAKRSA